MKATFDVLCSSGEACPMVMNAMEKLNFESVKETPNSTTSDITAIIKIENEKEIEKIAEQLFKKTEDSIEQLSIETKN